MVRVTLLAVLMASVLAVSEACSCIDDPDPLKAYCNSYDVIIKGVALSEKPDSPSSGGRSFYREYTVRVEQAIRVPDSLKNANTITVRTAIDGSMCGRSFPLNSEIIVVGQVNDDGKVRTNLCSYQRGVLALAARNAPCPASGQ